MASPLYFAWQRAVIAGAVLLLGAALLERPMPRGAPTWRCLAVIGLSATTLGFLGMFQASEFVTPGFATVLTETQPLIAAILSYCVFGERLSMRAQLGLMLGFAGIIVITLPMILNVGGNTSLIGATYVFLGALGVAFGNVLMKRIAGKVDPISATRSQCFIGSIALLASAMTFEEPLT